MSSTLARIAAPSTQNLAVTRNGRLGVSTGALVFGLEKAADVLRRWRDANVEGTAVRLLALGSASSLPRTLRGRRVVVVDGLDASAALTKQLRALGAETDTFGPASVTLGPALRDAADTNAPDMLTDRAVVDALGDRALARLVGAAGADSYTTLHCVELKVLPEGGAIAMTASGRVASGPAIPGVDRAMIARGDLARVMSCVACSSRQA